MNVNDSYQGKVPGIVSSEQLSQLMQLNQVKSALAIAIEWALIGLGIWVCEKYFNWGLYFLTVFWLGSRLHALGILMHDGAHYRIFKNKKFNDWVSEVLLAWPLTITMCGYRKTHWDHHRFLNTSKDPDWVQDKARVEFQFPKSKLKMLSILIKYLSGYYAIQEFKNASGYSEKTPASVAIPQKVLYLLLVAAALYWGFFGKLVMYWLVPLLTTFLFFMYVRAVSDHHAGPGRTHLFAQARTLKLNKFTAFLLFPWHINFHIEHHAYPGVPFYNLPRLHQILSQSTEYQQQAHLTQGFLGLVKECERTNE